MRLRVAKSWVKRPAAFWTAGMHAYVDNKAFPLPLTPAQKAKLQNTRVTGHLRRADEGLAPYCTKPKEKHSFIGIPSATITAAVAKDRIIMWHVVEGPWTVCFISSMLIPIVTQQEHDKLARFFEFLLACGQTIEIR